MRFPLKLKKRVLPYLLVFSTSFLLPGCAMQWGAAIQWNSKDQILMSESSQVKMRSIQTRVFDTTDKDKLMRAIINTLQDLYFDIDVMDGEFGIVSGKKLYQSGSAWQNNPTYYTYKTDNLVIFSTNYRTYGPFQYRNDLTRISVTIRPKGEVQLMVRTSIQHNLYAVEDPEVYQSFFRLLEGAVFLSAGLQ
ncbi:MAG: hypothetical protein L3J75_13285 [Methylococcaceae bacterium]|nr:hypothetical protein [Methylococcaceae bacterium]